MPTATRQGGRAAGKPIQPPPGTRISVLTVDVSDSKVRKALIKLLVASVILGGLVISCFVDSVGDLKGLILLHRRLVFHHLIGVDASRVIKREMPSHKSCAVLDGSWRFPRPSWETVLIGSRWFIPYLERASLWKTYPKASYCAALAGVDYLCAGLRGRGALHCRGLALETESVMASAIGAQTASVP